MAGDVFWIKLQTSTFDSETVMLLESMPEGDTILIIWFKMQILAGMPPPDKNGPTLCF